MSKTQTPTPLLREGFRYWTVGDQAARIVFVGRGPHRSRQQAYQELTESPRPRLTWPRQVHSATVLGVNSGGCCGEGDALMSQRNDLALSVATADCLPIVLAGTQSISTIHAGWRGLAQDIIGEVIARLSEPADQLRAWIGPAIGVCCYEVGEDVADQVAKSSGDTVRKLTAKKPHLDLIAAAEIQLYRRGLRKIDSLRICTRCHPEWLWSYRREGENAGRNWTFAWRT